jgi:hypothetical protein
MIYTKIIERFKILKLSSTDCILTRKVFLEFAIRLCVSVGGMIEWEWKIEAWELLGECLMEEKKN